MAKMKETMEEIEKMFGGIPELQRIFKSYERDIRYYNQFHWSKETTKEKLIEKRDVLLELAKKINNVDLRIMYYVENIDGLSKGYLEYLLKKLYLAQCEFKNGFYHTDRYVDILDVGRIVYGKGKKE